MVFHDSSILDTFGATFPNSSPLHVNFPSYTVSKKYSLISKKEINSNIITLGVFGTIRPYKNLEIVSSELGLLDELQLASLSLKLFGKAFYNIDKLVKDFESLSLADFKYNLESITDDQFYNEMADCDFLILPHSSSSGSALLSVAASLGIPIIASNLTVFRDFVDRYHSGIIFDHTDAGDLSQVISSLIHDKQKRKFLKDKALGAVTLTLSWDQYVFEISKCCEKLLTTRVR